MYAAHWVSTTYHPFPDLPTKGIKSLVAKDFNWMVNKKCDASNQVFSPLHSWTKTEKWYFQITFLLTYCWWHHWLDMSKTLPNLEDLPPIRYSLWTPPKLVAQLISGLVGHLHWFLVAFEEMPAAHHHGWLMDPPGTWLSHEKVDKFSLVVADEQVLWWICSYRSPIESTESRSVNIPPSAGWEGTLWVHKTGKGGCSMY